VLVELCNLSENNHSLSALNHYFKNRLKWVAKDGSPFFASYT